ncbi:hypothetical protein [Bacillus cihuensis]|nr:hypothetical protein [Bacillus cihuensis]
MERRLVRVRDLLQEGGEVQVRESELKDINSSDLGSRKVKNKEGSRY